MDYTKKYRSKEEYTPRKTSNMGVDLVEVVNGYGMISAILSENDFLQQFEEVPASETPSA